MALFDSDNIKMILDVSNIGLWRVEFEEGQPPRFYGDEVMDKLIGIMGDVTPEERFAFHHQYIHPDDLKMFEEYSDKLADERTEVVYRYNHPVYGEMFVRCSGLRDRSTTGYFGFYGTHQDISDTIRFEKEKFAETRLAEAVAEKEAALKKAKRASEAKTEFLSRMSHDIRTPLNGILGILDINEKHSDERELVDANRKKARIAANHLLSLINDILDMSKLEDDRIELAREPINIADICSEVLAMCSIRAKENGINLIYDEGIRLKYPNVIGSELHLKQVLMNILNNSVKYNRPGGSITYSIFLESYGDNTATYRFEITDTGIGMSKEFLQHIYEPFTQERNDARSRFQGTGMGMAIVKKLVDKMNGTITIESEKGVGSHFNITIPFEINHSVRTDNIRTYEEQKNISSMRILVVEDNELNMEIVTCILEDAGAIVTKAFNGSEAVDIFEEKRAGSFDVILMDIMMPVLDGYGATEQIRNSSKADAMTIPIIAMTANAFSEDVMKAKEVGMNEHLSKPLKSEVLIKTLGKYI